MDPRRVLVVTDIDLAGWALRQALTSAGFAVLTAADADAARTVVEAGDPFGVLVVSQSLGSESVAMLLEDVARQRPGVPAIVLEVDTESEPIRTRVEHVVLEKPYSVADVVALARGSALLRVKGGSNAQLPSRYRGAGKAGASFASRGTVP